MSTFLIIFDQSRNFTFSY